MTKDIAKYLMGEESKLYCSPPGGTPDGVVGGVGGEVGGGGGEQRGVAAGVPAPASDGRRRGALQLERGVAGQRARARGGERRGGGRGRDPWCRASNEGSRIFHNYGESPIHPYLVLLLVESDKINIDGRL